MKTEPNDSAFPATPTDNPSLHGLTKREHFAAMAMQGMLANSIDTQQGPEPFWHMPAKNVGLIAVEYADALIEALNTPVTLTEIK